MPTIVGILIFISRKNFILTWVEYEKSFITSGPGSPIEQLPVAYGATWVSLISNQVDVSQIQRQHHNTDWNTVDWNIWPKLNQQTIILHGSKFDLYQVKSLEYCRS